MSNVVEYPIGMLVTSTMKFRNRLTGAFVDPAVVTYQLRRPDETNDATLTFGVGTDIVKDSTGIYHCNFIVDMMGLFHSRWLGTAGGLGTGGSVSSEEQVRGTQSGFV